MTFYCPYIWSQSTLTVLPTFDHRAHWPSTALTFWPQSTLTLYCPYIWPQSTLTLYCPYILITEHTDLLLPSHLITEHTDLLLPSHLITEHTDLLLPSNFITEHTDLLLPSNFITEHTDLPLPLLWSQITLTFHCDLAGSFLFAERVDGMTAVAAAILGPWEHHFQRADTVRIGDVVAISVSYFTAVLRPRHLWYTQTEEPLVENEKTGTFINLFRRQFVKRTINSKLTECVCVRVRGGWGGGWRKGCQIKTPAEAKTKWKPM